MPEATSPKFTFVDLFAGIGGFHAVGHGLGGKCVFAAEIDEGAADVYERNWGVNPRCDITKVANDELVVIPEHDVLFAGFPCQPFSKSGAQKGMEETRGTLFWNIAKVIEARKPKLVVLENVRNLVGPRHAHEWAVIIETLRDLNYAVSEVPAIFSPHLLPPELGGRPQVRERVFITATWQEAMTNEWCDLSPVVTNRAVRGWEPSTWHLEADLPLEPQTSQSNGDLSDSETLWLDAWNEFVVEMLILRKGRRLPGFPLWADAWGKNPSLCEYDGAPKWKIDFLKKNREFYSAHQDFIDRWLAHWQVYSHKFPPSRRKLEWQAQDAKSLWECVIHLRPSGVRAKRATYLPALVAITQTSIFGPQRRRITVREAARLQGLPEWFDFGRQPDTATFRQLGNGVSIGAAWHVLKMHVARDEDILKSTAPNLLAAIAGAPDNPDEVLASRP